MDVIYLLGLCQAILIHAVHRMEYSLGFDDSSEAGLLSWSHITIVYCKI
jgi:hypothetical protein